MAFLEIKNLTKTFGKTEVLKGIDLELEHGEVLSIIGSSGSGKTTLLRCLNYLETADSGTITIGGDILFDGSVSVKDKNSVKEIREKRLKLGMVFQSFNLFPHMSVLKNVTLAPTLYVKDRIKLKKAELKLISDRKKAKEELTLFKDGINKQIEEEAKEVLERVGLGDKLNAYPCELSGGQQQRVSIGRALINAPAILLADEPTGNLDSKNSQEIVELLKLSNKKYNQTLIVITHDENIALQADRVITIEDGKIKKDEVLRR